MHSLLLGNVAEEPTSFRPPSHFPLPRVRGGANDLAVAGAMCGSGCCFLMTFFMFCVAAVSPLEYGLKRSSVTGAVDNDYVQGGLHPVAPWQSYITFPATRVTMEWSDGGNSDRPRVSTRTGADPSDPDSGGQPVYISCAVQFVMNPETLRATYLSYTSYEGAKAQYMLNAGNMVSNTAQEFTPQDFWVHRPKIAKRMLEQINTVLAKNGAEAVSFEILKVDFAQAFEDSITSVQIAEQQSVVNEYAQQVQQVDQHINVLTSANEATIAKIKAGADKTAKERIGKATKSAFIMKQQAKATTYAALQKALEFTPAQMAEYIKIRSLMAQSSNGRVVASIPPPQGTEAKLEL